MQTVLSSGQVAELLGVRRHRLDYLTRDRQLRPVKGPTGAFCWTVDDVQAAAHLLGVAVPAGLPTTIGNAARGPQ